MASSHSSHLHDCFLLCVSVEQFVAIIFAWPSAVPLSFTRAAASCEILFFNFFNPFSIHVHMCVYKSLLVACTYLNSTHPRPHNVVYELLGLAEQQQPPFFSLQTDGDLSLNAQTAGSSNIQKITITERVLYVSHVYLLAGEDVLEIVETANKNLLVLKSRQNPTCAVLFLVYRIILVRRN